MSLDGLLLARSWDCLCIALIFIFFDYRTVESVGYWAALECIDTTLAGFVFMASGLPTAQKESKRRRRKRKQWPIPPLMLCLGH